MATAIDNLSVATSPGNAAVNWPRPSRVLPPAIVLDGGVNAVSIARSLGRMGVTVYALNEPTSFVRHSRYARWIRTPEAKVPAEAWADFLLGPESDHLRGAVLIVAGDAGLELLIEHWPELSKRFRLDDMNPAAQQCMMNKLSTYRAAAAAGVPTPRFWLAKSADDLAAIRDELVYPLLVKPTVSHLFDQRFGIKFIEVKCFAELRAALARVGDTGMEFMLVELIPGPDDRLCSYYTYLDAEGEPQFDFTKRIIRRFPVGQGNGCCHVTDRNPEIRELALKLFRHVGLRGMANVEFKRDDRDGRLKLVECNARFTAADCLVARAGLNLGRFVYRRIVGLPPERLANYRTDLRLWYPIDDFLAFRELRRRGEITLRQWLASVAHRQTLPLFQFRDPLPTLVNETRRLKRIVGRVVKKVVRRA